MSNRQERRARKQRQRDGVEVYIHVKPTRRRLLGPVSNRAEQRMRRLYGKAF